MVLALLGPSVAVRRLVLLGFGRVEYPLLRVGLLGRPRIRGRIDLNRLQLVKLGLGGLGDRLERLIVLGEEGYVAHLEGSGLFVLRSVIVPCVRPRAEHIIVWSR